LKDGTLIPARQVINRLAGFASALGALDGGLTISGGGEGRHMLSRAVFHRKRGELRGIARGRRTN